MSDTLHLPVSLFSFMYASKLELLIIAIIVISAEVYLYTDLGRASLGIIVHVSRDISSRQELGVKILAVRYVWINIY